MRVYEELFILKPDTTEEDVESYIGQVKDLITNGKGTIEKVDNWGIRKLAYRVSKFAEGRYILIQFSSSPELVHEVERRMRVNDGVIKFITVRIDEKLKKIAKRKKSRDKRAARKPAPVIPPPSMPMEAAALPGVPGEAKPMPAAPAAPAAPVAATPVAATPVAPTTPAAEKE
jgi:small subunit ribosomal protein S6